MGTGRAACDRRAWAGHHASGDRSALPRARRAAPSRRACGSRVGAGLARLSSAFSASSRFFSPCPGPASGWFRPRWLRIAGVAFFALCSLARYSTLAGCVGPAVSEEHRAPRPRLRTGASPGHVASKTASPTTMPTPRLARSGNCISSAPRARCPRSGWRAPRRAWPIATVTRCAPARCCCSPAAAFVAGPEKYRPRARRLRLARRARSRPGLPPRRVDRSATLHGPPAILLTSGLDKDTASNRPVQAPAGSNIVVRAVRERRRHHETEGGCRRRRPTTATRRQTRRQGARDGWRAAKSRHRAALRSSRRRQAAVEARREHAGDIRSRLRAGPSADHHAARRAEDRYARIVDARLQGRGRLRHRQRRSAIRQAADQRVAR